MSKRKTAGRVRAPKNRGGRTTLKVLVVLLSIPVIFAAVFLIRYYYIFDGIIEQKLGKKFDVSATRIFARPVLLYPGRPFNRTQLVAKLRELGYAEGSAADVSKAAGYELTDDRVLIRNDEAVPVNSGQSAEVLLSAKSIRAIVNPETRRNLASFSLKPELLSTAINKNREKRRFVAYGDLPRVVVHAILASEDRRFFSHTGVDPIRIVKALIIDVQEGDKVQGGSTLTQQFVKNYFLTQERTWKRKLTDAYMSILLEQRLTKEQIFELYCNEVYLGQRGSFSIVGVGEAAEAFFDKDVKDLALGEAALIAGIISAPNRYTPLRYPDRARARRNLVLHAMADYGMISAEERDETLRKAPEIKPSTILNYSDAPYFVDYVQDILIERYGDAALGELKYQVFSTLDLDLQKAAFESVREGILELDAHFAKGKRAIPPGTVQASLIAVNPRTGEVLAMVGGRNYGTGQFNRITQARRQPGSIFKPFVYAAALETAYHSSAPLTTVSTVIDEKTQFAFEDLAYEPRNFEDEYLGQVTMRQAVAKSLNVATVKFAQKVGYEKVVELAHRLGLNEQIKSYPAMAIGAFEVTPLEMVRAYTAFANGGLLAELTPILQIRDGSDKSAFVAETQTRQVLTHEIAHLITSMLKSVVNNGSGIGVRSRGFAHPAAGKTGTSRDGWFAGYTPDLLCIVWVGFDDNRELNLSGSQSALPIWTSFMKKAATLMPLSGEEFSVPEGIQEVEIDPSTGLLAGPNCMERQMEFFIKGTEPVVRCYGNMYEHMLGGNPTSIYATPVNEADGTKLPPAPEPKKPTS
jgi:penicillin-binding protein 1B